MQKELLKEVLLSQKKSFLNKKNLFWRDILFDFYKKYHKTKEAIVITGVRRCGKSSLMRLIWEEFKHADKLADKQLLYVNFEDERLIGFNKDDFTELLESHFQLNGPDVSGKIYLFLDEIQNVPFWEKWINRIIEEDKYKIFITGSNATLLSSELSSSLTGRNIPVTLYPLSFKEYFLYFRGQKISTTSFYDLEERAVINNNLDKYLLSGGMPEFIKTGSVELIQEYFKDIISRDIVNRYHVKYRQGLKELAHLLLVNLGQIQSLKKISQCIEIKNINTVKNYLKYLEESFLFFGLPLFSYSYKKQIYNPDKYYAVDIGFFNNIAFKNSDNAGSVYENVIFLELKKDRANKVFYYKTKKNFEVDFVVQRKNKIVHLIQSAYDLSNAKTKEREKRALYAAMDELNMKEGIILNKDLEETERTNGKLIRILPLWKWLFNFQTLDV